MSSASSVKRMRGLAIHRAILIGNTATPLTELERMGAPPDHTHKWTVAVRSAASHPLPTISEADQLGLPVAGSSSKPSASDVAPSAASATVSNEAATTSAGGGSGTASGSAGSTAAAASSSAGMSTRGRDFETDYHKMVGGKDDISHFIKRVQFKLHETYPQHTRNIDKPPFQVTETGWGEFDIQIKIFFVAESGEKPISTFHRLKLHPWHPIAVPAPSAGLSVATGGDGTDVSLGGMTAAQAPASDTTQATISQQPPIGIPTVEVDSTGGDTAKKEGDLAMSNAVDSTTGDVNADGATSQPAVDDGKQGESSLVAHETRSASAAALPSAHLRNMPAVVHSWSYDEIVFPEPTDTFYDVLIANVPTPLAIQSSQAFSEPSTFRRYKLALEKLDASSGPQGRDVHVESGILPPHPLHDATGAAFDALSQEAMLAEGERLDRARFNAVREIEETRAKLIEGESRLRQGRPKLATV